MGNLLAYSGLTTKIHAMESKLITSEEFQDISQLTSVSELVTYLQHHRGYQATFSDMNPDAIHRGDIEVALRFDIFRDFTKIYNFANPKQRRYLQLYFMKYEVKVLKRYLRIIFDSRESSVPYTVNVNDFELHSHINTSVVSQSATVEEMVGHLKGTIYYEPLQKLHPLENLTLFDYELCLDLFYYSTIWGARKKYFKGDELDIITHSYGIKIDLLNIAWIYRTKKYFTIDNNKIFSLLIPVHYKLKKEDTVRLVNAEGLKEFFDILSQTYYQKYLSSNNQELSLEQLEAKTLEQVHIKDYKHDPYSLATVNTYLYLKEKEIARIITATECIRYGFQPEDIVKQLAK